MSLLDLLPKVKRERESEVRKKVAIGTAIGLTVGAVAGVLLAPKAGKESRDDLVKTIGELPGKAKELSDKAHKMVGEATGKIAEETHKIMCREKEMLAGLNEDVLKGQWHELRGGIKAKWGKLTDNDLTTVEGQFEKLMGILQTKYGYSKDKAKEECDDFINANKK
ncbi:MAG: hypothetical protein H6Q76_2601 [Firmicutes bacterium]|nr:hypothetical protein [Bacillota bacterium]